MFLICSYFFRYLSLNVIISRVLTQQIACILGNVDFVRWKVTSNGSWACPQIHGREVCWVGRATKEMCDGIGVGPTFQAESAVGGADAEFIISQLGLAAGPELGVDAACRAGERRLGSFNLWRRDAQNLVYHSRFKLNLVQPPWRKLFIDLAPDASLSVFCLTFGNFL